jgi:hypothetical protein
MSCVDKFDLLEGRTRENQYDVTKIFVNKTFNCAIIIL